METDLTKPAINAFLAVVAPGAVLLLCSFWCMGVFYPSKITGYSVNELLFLFVFLLFAYLVGLLLDKLAEKVEGLFLTRLYGAYPSVKIVERYPHWLETLNEHYLQATGISLYELDEAGLPKAGQHNSKKLHKYNLRQFERFAVFTLASHNLTAKTDALKAKYLLLRNLVLPFLVCGVCGVVTWCSGMLAAAPAGLWYHPPVVLCASLLFLFVCCCLPGMFRKSRITYLTELYRDTRFLYLSSIKK